MTIEIDTNEMSLPIFADKYSKWQAWIDLQAMAMEGHDNLSYSQLATRWQWSKTTVHRFLKSIGQAERSAKRSVERSVERNKNAKMCAVANKNSNTGLACGTFRGTVNETANETGKNKKNPAATLVPSINFNDFCIFFNSEMDKVGALIPRIRSLSPAREAMLKARAKEHGKAALATVVRNAAQSSFLNGRNDRQFIASFDWLFRPNNFPKVLDGNYNDNKNIINTLYNANNPTGNSTIQQRDAELRQQGYANVMRELLGDNFPYTDNSATQG